MTLRHTLVRDLARHLSDDVRQIIERHARMAEGGGVSVLEMSAIMMTVAENVTVQAIGTVLLVADDRRRTTLFDETIEQLVRALNGRRNTVLASINLAEAVARR